MIIGYLDPWGKPLDPKKCPPRRTTASDRHSATQRASGQRGRGFLGFRGFRV